MSALVRTILGAVLVLALALAATAQEGAKQAPPADGAQKSAPPTTAEAIREAAKARYGFHAWPGKVGPSRDGIDLAGLAASDPDRQWTWRAAPGGPVAQGYASSERAESRVLVWVEETPLEAQEALLGWLAGCTRPLSRSTDLPGDIAFATEGSGGFAFALVRANVAVAVVGLGDMDMASLAKELDGRMRSAGLLDGKRRRTAIEGATLRVRRASSMNDAAILEIEGADGALAREARAVNGDVDEGPDGLLRVRPSSDVPARVEVHLLSPRGWRSTVETLVAGPPAPR